MNPDVSQLPFMVGNYTTGELLSSYNIGICCVSYHLATAASYLRVSLPFCNLNGPFMTFQSGFTFHFLVSFFSGHRFGLLSVE